MIQPRTVFLLQGLGLHPESGPVSIPTSLYGWFTSKETASDATTFFKENSAIWSGVINGMSLLSPDSDFWKTAAGANAYWLAADWARSHSADLLDIAGNDFFLGRFSVTGDRGDLAELVRRSQHRDGSTAAIGVGSDVLSLFHEAHESTSGIVIDGFDLANVKFGDRGPISLDLANLFPGIPEVSESAGSTAAPEVLSAGETTGELSDANATVTGSKAMDTAIAGAAAVAPAAPAARAARVAARRGGLSPEQAASKVKSENKHRPVKKTAAKKSAK